MKTVYVESSIISHACLKPGSRPNLVYLQDQARRWWQFERPKYEVVISQFVVDEIKNGNPEAVARRMEMIDSIPVLLPGNEVEQLAQIILSRSLMPPKALMDALHVAVAVEARLDYLLTLNCQHIANAHALPDIYSLIRQHGWHCPLICTPSEFLGD